MSSKSESLLLTLASLIATSVFGLIIELPADYNVTAPWEQLAALGLENVTETDCLRPCVEGEFPRVCVYRLVLEFYATMGTACGNCSQGILEDCFRPQCIPADGHERGAMSINRMIPGPQIHVCKNDLIVAKVVNRMTGTGSTLHWHGVVQRHSPWMDGVPRLTQCPIGAGETFTYVFQVEEGGTMFYHSHAGQQKMNGHYGALIVREPRSDEAWPLDVYSLDLPEHTMLLSDWMHDYAEMFFPGLPTRKPGIRPTTILCNGLGRYLDITGTEESSNVSVPLATFHVERDQRYRLRIINAATMYCPLQIQIEKHRMTLIATDGRYIEPVTVNTLVIYEGERFDVVIDTHGVTRKRNAFWIHIRALGVCEFKYKLDQYAVLSYGTNKTDLGIIPTGPPPTVSKPLPTKTIVNHPNITCGVSRKRLCITDLKAIGEGVDVDILTAKPDVQLLIPFGSHEFDNIDDFHREGNYQRFSNPAGHIIESAVMNNLSFTFLTTPTLFVRDRDPGFCNPHKLPATCQNDGDNSTTPYCECSYFEIIKENNIVELTFIDSFGQAPGINHAMHLHGYGFYVMYMYQDLSKPNGYTVDEVREILYEKGLLDLESRNLNKTRCAPSASPIKDVVSVPSRGFTTVRWKANNPGDWLLHCHFDWHAILGMVMGFRVEGEIPQRPPNFPTCSGFTPW